MATGGAVDLPKVTGDPDLLVQLLLNIALNGVQAMAPGGGTLTFSLGTERQGGEGVRAGARREHGAADPGGEPRADLRPVLHHEGRRDGARALHLLPHRRRARGDPCGPEPAGGRGVEFSLTLPAAEGMDAGQ